VKKLQVLAWLSMTFSGVAAACLFCIGFVKLSKAKKRHGGLVPLIRTKFRTGKVIFNLRVYLILHKRKYI